MACGKLAGHEYGIVPGMLMWHVYERTLKNQRFLSLQNQINYRQNQLRSPRREQLAAGRGEGERREESEPRPTAFLAAGGGGDGGGHDEATSWRLLTAVSCNYTRNASITVRLVSTLTFCSFACGDQDEVPHEGRYGGRDALPDIGRKSPKRASPKCPHCSRCVMLLLLFL